MPQIFGSLALVYTGQRRLTEASPHDKLWGIGLSACDYRASSPGTWRGSNLLGQALEHVRETLCSETMPQIFGSLALVYTGQRRLAEASPHDKLWGIGLSACGYRASSPGTWRGSNLLGQALEHVRETLCSETMPQIFGSLALVYTGQRRLAEASPHDKLWGIGLSACDYRASSPGTWRGSNLLGQALEHVRETPCSETMPQIFGS